MGKGIAALAYLPEINISIDGTGGGSIETMKSVAKLVAKFQNEGTADGTYNAVKEKSLTPYHSVAADVVVSGSGESISATLVPSDTEELDYTDALGRAALSTRREISFEYAANATPQTVRGILAALNYVEKLEDVVASEDSDTSTNGTFNIEAKGHTPYDRYPFTIVKSGNAYTLYNSEAEVPGGE